MGHIPYCVPLPHAWHQRCRGGCLHSDRLLRFRHHLQVWCGIGDLPDLLCKVQQREPSVSLLPSHLVKRLPLLGVVVVHFLGELVILRPYSFVCFMTLLVNRAGNFPLRWPSFSVRLWMSLSFYRSSLP